MFAIVRRVTKVQGYDPEDSGVDGQRQARGTDSPGARGISRGGLYDRTVEGGKGTEAVLTTWYRRLGRPPFKTVVELAQNSASGIVISELPVKILGLDACAECVVGKSVDLPRTE